ncbi:MAG: ATP-binding protein, partial [Bacteroidota bacterium]
YNDYKRINEENLGLARKLNDSNARAVAYHNIAVYHRVKLQNDSAYYSYSNALKYYSPQREIEKIANVLLNIADIQDTEQDLINSEKNAIKSLILYESLPENEINLDNQWTLNNLLGIVSIKLGNLENSFKYHSVALKIADEMNNGYYNSIFSRNNIALVYRKQNNLDAAINYYSELAEVRNTYDEYDPTFYPLVLTNLAYTELLAGKKNYAEMERKFRVAYQISDSLNDPVTRVAVSIDFSKYFKQQKERDSSFKYANIAYKLSKEIGANEILLDALKVLSELKPGEDGKAYLNEYIKLSDSLLNVERNVRNKFARIEFETDKIEEENEKMAVQRRWLFIVSAALLLALVFLYIIVNQRSKNKQLRYEKDQQKANEEIYNLMLSQQDKVDEARANEKKRISQDMHDGILGRLFGTRLSLDSLNFSEGKDAIMSRAQYITELKNIENDIRKISHDLNTDFVAGSNFMTIVSELIEKQTRAYGIDYNFEYEDDIAWDNLSNKTKINIYRIIQESLQNIYKHADATCVNIAFELENEDICLEISDDGKGFDVNRSRKGIGIKNINSRADEFEGKAVYDSDKGKGTTLKIYIPQHN